MKKVSTKIVLSTIVSLLVISGCAQKKVIPVLASTQPAANQTGTTTQDNVQNYAPYDQGAETNPAYYGNGAYVTDDASSFGAPTTPNTGTPTTDTTNTNSTTPSNPTMPSDPSLGGDDTSFDIPSDIPNLEPYSPPGGPGSAGGYSLSGNFAVDQDNYIPPAIPYIGAFAPSKNQWQAVGVAASGSTIYVTAFDNSGFFKKGTIITMTDSGTSWLNAGGTLLGTKHPLDATVRGITVDASSQKAFAVDSVKYMYALAKGGSPQKVDAGISGGIDTVFSNGNLYVATSSGVKKYDPSSLTSLSDVGTGITPTGGIGSDAEGNLYVITGSSIKKVTSDGKATDIITNLSGAIDVTVNDDKNICVLSSEGISIYDPTGKPLTSLGQGDFLAPTAIVANGKDLYVSDTGDSYQTSQIVKYSIMTL
jgi:hypothetical protein